MDDFVQITTTTPTEEEAGRIAAALIELRLAACVQIEGPVASHYRWEGKVHCDREFRLSIKTAARHFADVEQIILKQHTYSLPQIIAVPIINGSVHYLDWIREQTASE